MFEEILKLEDDNVEAMNGLFYCKEHFGEIEEAFKIAQKAYEIDPNHHETNFNLGGYYLDNTTEHERTLQYFQKAAETAPDDKVKVKCLFNLAKVEEELENKEKAISLYDEVI